VSIEDAYIPRDLSSATPHGITNLPDILMRRDRNPESAGPQWGSGIRMDI
jgi:hypothetical protein